MENKVKKIVDQGPIWSAETYLTAYRSTKITGPPKPFQKRYLNYEKQGRSSRDPRGRELNALVNKYRRVQHKVRMNRKYK